MLHGTDNISRNVPGYISYSDCMGEYQEILCGILSISHNNVMDLNNAMLVSFK